MPATVIVYNVAAHRGETDGREIAGRSRAVVIVRVVVVAVVAAAAAAAAEQRLGWIGMDLSGDLTKP